jgi:hypothetical protein
MQVFCDGNAKEITREAFNKYYKHFESRYLGGYSPEIGYFFQSHFVISLFDKWLADNRLIDDSGNVRLGTHYAVSVPLSQKVLECLALKGPSTFEQIVNDINTRERFKRSYGGLLPKLQSPKYDSEFGDVSSKEKIREILDAYTLSTEYLQQMRSRKFMSRPSSLSNHLDLLKHILITEKNGTYGLSLFGLMLILFLTNFELFLDRDRRGQYVEPYFFMFKPLMVKLEPGRVYDHNRLASNYHADDYDRIASNYHNKLPLVFGKWRLLKDTMAKSQSGSLNEVAQSFFNRDKLRNWLIKPIPLGFKEYYEGVQSLALNASLRLTKICNELEELRYPGGYDVDADDVDIPSSSRSKDLFAEKLKEIRANLMFTTTVDRFVGSLYKEEYRDLNVEKIVSKLESIYANELSFLFYLLVGRGGGKDLVAPPQDKRERFIDIEDDYTEDDYPYIEDDLSPSPALIGVLRKDNDIKTQFSRWIKDSIVHQKNVRDITIRYLI